ncbi:MAG TPA: hypothetical protein DDZ51_07215 [Planctomycetaceae bacterium]|nr:hypothetical protein [Planctomycetaceae bacterium]
MSELGPWQVNNGATFGLATPGVESFHRALQAALRSGAALDLGPAAIPKSGKANIPAGRLTISKLQILQASVQVQPPDRAARPQQQIGPTEMLAAAFGDLAAALPQKYVAGFSVYRITGRTDLVLDAMSVDMWAKRELARVARPSLAYLAILVLTGGVLGSGVLALTLLVVDALRSDLLRAPHSLATQSEMRPWITESQFFILPWIALILLLGTSVSLLTPVSAWIVKCLGGFGYLISQRRALAARIEYALVLAGIEGAEAEQAAARLVGPQPTRKRTLRTVSRGDQSPSDLQRLGLEAKHFHDRSNTRLRQLRIALPLLLVMTIGSIGVLAYSLAMFIPLTNLLYELAAPAVDPVMKQGNR